MVKNILKLFVFVFFFTNYLFGQKLNFRYYNVDEGLPQATVYDIFQDNHGFLWFGTQGGVARFDGLEFDVFNQKQGLSENHVVKIYQDNQDIIWLGHRYEGVSCLVNDKAISYNEILKGISEPISSFIQSGNYLLVGTLGNGLYVLDLTSRSDSSIVYKQYDISKGLSGDNIYDFFKDKSGNIWIATDNGITIVNPDLNFRTAYYLNNKNKLPAFKIYDIEIDEANYLWISTERGILKLKHDPITWVNYKTLEVFNKESGIQSNEIKHLCVDAKNAVWLVSDQGVGKIKNNKVQWYTEANGFSSNNVSCVIKDREGNLWFGVFGTGACQYLGDNFSTFDKEAGLMSNMIQALYIDADNNLWVGTDKGLNKIKFIDDYQNGIEKIDSYFPGKGLYNDNIRVIFQDSRKWIWVGTDEGVSYMIPGKNNFSNLNKTKNFNFGRINAFNEDKKGNIWAASVKGGCYKIEFSNEDIENVEKVGEKEGLFSDKIWTIYKNVIGELIFGTNDKGLFFLSGNSFTNISSKDNMPSDRPGAITEDVYGNLWIASIGKGVIKYDILNTMRSGKKEFKSFGTNEGIGSDNPYLITTDNNNNIWIGTNYGVDRFNEKKLQIDHFGKAEGFIGIETNQNAVFKDKHGHIWFGTIKGVVKCKPEAIRSNLVEPSILIKDIRIFHKKENLPINHQFEYYRNHFTFDFVGISLSDPNNVSYQYKLQGFDEDWSPLTKDRFATFSNLPHGEYTFYVKAMNSSGVWSKQFAHYTFKIKPPFWNTTWFYILLSVILLGLIYSIIFIRTRSLNSSKRKLEMLVLNRTRELISEKNKVEQINKEVVAQKSIIEQKNKDITDSINYARRIQQAILPNQDIIKKEFADSFVLFRPKDIVSGDFYWFLKSGKIVIIAAVDCTGHGVPGAFMSVIGNDLLNNIIVDPQVKTPGQALTIMDTKIRKMLMSKLEEEAPDGMDISLCAFDCESNEMQFAGANRPLFLIRNNKLIEYKPDKKSIGGDFESAKVFTNNNIKLEKDDLVYLFSDGYADQFGGEHKKKIMTRRFKQELTKISHLSLNEQKKYLEKYFEEWKGDMEQVDDILVIGIRI